jgi:hypothetical protein
MSDIKVGVFLKVSEALIVKREGMFRWLQMFQAHDVPPRAFELLTPLHTTQPTALSAYTFHGLLYSRQQQIHFSVLFR